MSANRHWKWVAYSVTGWGPRLNNCRGQLQQIGFSLVIKPEWKDMNKFIKVMKHLISPLQSSVSLINKLKMIHTLVWSFRYITGQNRNSWQHWLRNPKTSNSSHQISLIAGSSGLYLVLEQLMGAGRKGAGICKHKNAFSHCSWVTWFGDLDLPPPLQWWECLDISFWL